MTGEVKVPDIAGYILSDASRASCPQAWGFEAGREHPTASLKTTGGGCWLRCHSFLDAMAEVNIRQEEHEHMSTSLEVEQLDSNLFRSKSLWLPIRARGVYGGQVISQALVSATNCVPPDYALHVRASS